jgi:hypothetical protein
MAVASVVTRKRLLKELTPRLRTGDMALRFGNAMHFVPMLFGFGLRVPFSRWAQDLFKTPWSHAAVVIVDRGSVSVVDMSDEGLRKFTLQDWLLECHDGGAVQICRVKPEHAHKVLGIVGHVEVDRARQPEYDYQFAAGDLKYYCTEFTHSMYVKCGIPMPEARPLSEAPGMTWGFKLAALAQGLSLKTKVISPKELSTADSFFTEYLFVGEAP